MDTYNIPFTARVKGTLRIKADNEEAARRVAEDESVIYDSTDLQVSDWQVEPPAQDRPPRKFQVMWTDRIERRFSVMARSRDEARQLAAQKIMNEENPGPYWQIDFLEEAL